MEASAERLQQVIESLTGNEALTDQLDDAAAQTLLDWGIAAGKAVVQSTAALPDADDAMQPRLKAIRHLLRAVNGYFTPAPDTAASDPQAHAAATVALLQRVGEHLATIEGDRFAKPDEAQLAAFAAQLAPKAASPQTFIEELRNFFAQPAPPAAGAESPIVTPPAPVVETPTPSPAPVAESPAVPPPPTVAPTTLLRTDWLARVFSQLRRFYRQPHQ